MEYFQFGTTRQIKNAAPGCVLISNNIIFLPFVFEDYTTFTFVRRCDVFEGSQPFDSFHSFSAAAAIFRFFSL